MKKRILMVLLIAVLVAGAAFAAPEFKMSAGGGGFYAGDFGGGGFKLSAGDEEMAYSMPYTGIGGYGFFDLTYVELSIGFFSGTITPTMTIKEAGVEVSGTAPDMTFSSLNFGVYGKYPIAISDKFSLFPLVGLEYWSVTSVEQAGVSYRDPEKLSTIWVRAGVGGDISFTDSIYLRLGVLYGIRMENQHEKDLTDFYKALAALGGDSVTVESLLGHGLTARLAVGFKF